MPSGITISPKKCQALRRNVGPAPGFLALLSSKGIGRANALSSRRMGEGAGCETQDDNRLAQRVRSGSGSLSNFKTKGLLMPIGAPLHIGLNAVDPKHYSGWDGQLTACEFDANDMQALAKTQGFTKVTKRLTKRATRNRVLADIKAAAAKLKRNDIFFLTYSGHGGQVPNTGNDFEPDGFDETWCLYDGELIDDELYAALDQFDDGVRIFVLCESC